MGNVSLKDVVFLENLLFRFICFRYIFRKIIFFFFLVDERVEVLLGVREIFELFFFYF